MTTSVVTYNLAGHVRHQGLPVSNVNVAVYDCHRGLSNHAFGGGESLVQQQKTGSRGEFTFALRPGKYRLEVEPDLSTRFLRHNIPEIDVQANTTCNVSLSTGSILNGKVCTESGQLITGGEVVALGIEPSSYRANGAVDEDGKYMLILPRGKYHLAFRSPQILQASMNEDQTASPEGSGEAESEDETEHPVPFFSSEIFVLTLNTDDDFDLVLPDFAKFEGEITDVFGQPVKNARISLSPARPRDNLLFVELGLSASCMSDNDGKFQMQIQPDLYNLSIEPDESGLLFGFREQGLELIGDLFRKFQLHEGFRLRGQVHYDEQLLSQCLVRVEGLDDKHIEMLTRTDSKGQFSVGVPAGNYKLVVTAHPKDAPSVTINGAEYSGLAPWTRMVVVGGDTHVAVRLQQGTAVYGRISDDAGQARPGVRISVFGESTKPLEQEKQVSALASGITDNEGNYCVFLSPGTYWFAIHTDLVNAQVVEVGSEPVNLNIAWHGWCQLRFEVIGEDARKIPRCRVGYAPYGADQAAISIADAERQANLPRGYILTGEDGMCLLTLPAGIYTMSFSPPPDGSYGAKAIKQLSISSDMTRTIKLPLIDVEHVDDL